MTLDSFLCSAIGVPYFDGGRDYNGWDCYGTVFVLYRDVLGINLPTYSETPAADIIAVAAAFDGEAVSGLWAKVAAPLRFDVVQMWTHEHYQGRTIRGRRHCGVMIDGRRMLHTERGTASVLVPLNHHLVRERIIAFWRHRSLLGEARGAATTIVEPIL